jgi:hypothetical protein
MHNRDFVWKASAGRSIPMHRMTHEHLVNTLNYLESDPPPCRRVEDEQYRGDAYFHLRCEAMLRGLRWRNFAGQPPLRNDDLAFLEGRWVRKDTPSHRFDPAGQDSWEGNNLIGREVEVQIKRDNLHTTRLDDVGILHAKGILKSLKVSDSGVSVENPNPLLSQITPGTRFRLVHSKSENEYVKLELLGEMLRSMRRDHTQAGPGFIRCATVRYVVANVATGSTYLMPGYTQVTPIDEPAAPSPPM